MSVHNLNRRGDAGSWVILGIAVIAIALIVYFLPRAKKPGYDIVIGKPWTYARVEAPFQFSIYKNKKQIDNEKDSIAKSASRYFNFDKNVERKAVSLFSENFTKNLAGDVPYAYYDFIKKKLHEVYQTGIVDNADYEDLAANKPQETKVINGNQAHTIATSQLLSIRKAYEIIMNYDTIRYDRSTLLRCNLDDYIRPNMTLDRSKTKAAILEAQSYISNTYGVVQKGQKIIDRGDIVHETEYDLLNSLQEELNKQSGEETAQMLTLLGQVIFALIIIGCFTMYLKMFRPDYYSSSSSLLLMFGLISLFSIITSMVVSHKFYSVSIIPFAAAPMLVKIFLDSRTALITHITMILLCSISCENPYNFIIMQSIAGIVAILSLKELSRRSQLFRSAVYVAIIYSVTYTSFQLVSLGDINAIDTNMYRYYAINGALLLFVYLMMFPIERALGFTSDVTYVELSDTNNPALRRLSEEAPGTFQHSLQVANLAGEIANRIGAKSQLVRTGALYHDIGKLYDPTLFTENQTGGFNPHNLKTLEDSAYSIISHVSNGIKMAESEKLPKFIKDFIATHHGRNKTQYFYVLYKKEHPDEEINESLFTYPGPYPFTLEQGILMMADSVEAASRSLQEYSETSINELVDKIVDGQVKSGAFNQCPISFPQISKAKEVMKEKLRTIYHTRIAYPETNEPEEKEEVEELTAE